ncbi:PTB domain-containing engulfment adapter protein 1 isoform X2 [Clupea harengus]|uniref:PTB domain-containing engulfment adapter protein 1 n=1 Tax=Clupea harengus TaxID=7950 RepID=A0A6P8ETS3_CLUHA|nr:PTB domain-containing engulfment adapter protein 1 isoform X2 [Clupea harengus]
MVTEASGFTRRSQKISTLNRPSTSVHAFQSTRVRRTTQGIVIGRAASDRPETPHRTYSMNRAFSRKKDKPTMLTPEALVKQHVAYNAKFLGITEVDQPKGTDVVKVAVRKLKFQRHIKKSEGQKSPKVELQISIYGVKILDPKTKEVQHNCQLHRMSFCADDKTDKRIFTFICTDPETKTHLCYVFDSDKCAEEITLAIGQAFDLAYKKFLESGGKDMETRKQIGNLQKRIQDLEAENSRLKKQLQDLEDQLTNGQVSPLLHLNPSNEAFMMQRPSALFWCGGDLTALACLEISSLTLTPASSPDSSQSAGLITPPPSKPAQSKPLCNHSVPRPRAGSIPVRGRSTDVFDMVPFSPVSPMTKIPASNGDSPPPFTPPPPPPPPPCLPLKERSEYLTLTGMDLFGAEPFDPFSSVPADYSPDIQSKLEEMQRQRWRGSKWD